MKNNHHNAPGRDKTPSEDDHGFNPVLLDRIDELQDYYDFSPVGYLSLDSKGRFLGVNLTTAIILGTFRSQLMNESLYDYVVWEDRDSLYLHLRKIFQDLKPAQCELRIQNKDDDIIHVALDGIYTEDRKGRSVCRSVMADITERVRVEEALRESEEKFRLIAETSPDTIFQLDPKGRIMYCSPSIERIFGYTPAEIEGTFFEKYLLPSEIPEAGENFQRLLVGGGISFFEVHILAKSGTPGPVEVSAAPVAGEGEIRFIFGIGRDITERKKMERELRRSRDVLEKKVRERTAELKQANEILTAEVAKRRRYEEALKGSTQKVLMESKRRRFLSARLVETLEKDRREVAMYLHDDIGQRLATLKMDLETVRKHSGGDNGPLTEKLREFEAKVAGIMSHVKDISRRLRPDMLDTLGLVPALRALVEGFRSDFGLQVHFYSREPSGKMDPEKSLALYRITQEALSNVGKHAQATEVFVNLIVKGDSFLLSVEDDGVGFPYHETVENSTGEGPLGLMIMRERAALAGGELSVESEIGKGTHVVAEIPIV